MSFDTYKQNLLNLKVAKSGEKIAPHKSILLLAVLQLIAEGEIIYNKVRLTNQLKNKFDLLWSKYALSTATFRCNIAMPFWHLQSEPFWKFVHSLGMQAFLLRL